MIRYAYLWANEHAFGRSEGRKDRPAMVLALSVVAEAGEPRVMVLAVTHTAPRDPNDAVAFPVALKRSMGLDDRPAWIVTTEGNAFTWPGPDLRPVPRRTPRTVIYGRVPAGLLRSVATSYLANRARQRAMLVQRDQ